MSIFEIVNEHRLQKCINSIIIGNLKETKVISDRYFRKEAAEFNLEKLNVLYPILLMILSSSSNYYSDKVHFHVAFDDISYAYKRILEHMQIF